MNRAVLSTGTRLRRYVREPHGGSIAVSCSSDIKQTLLLVRSKPIYPRRTVGKQRNVIADQDNAASHG